MQTVLLVGVVIAFYLSLKKQDATIHLTKEIVGTEPGVVEVLGEKKP